MKHIKRANNHPAGFSLIEVTLTIGIVAVVMVPLMGLISVSSRTNFDSSTMMLSGAIATEIMGRVQQADSTQIDDWEGESKLDFYYDYEGQRVTDIQEASFTARLQVLPQDLILGSGISNPYAQKAVVYVCSLPGTAGAEEIDGASVET